MYFPLQKVYSNTHNINIVNETDKNKFKELKGEEILMILDLSSSASKDKTISAAYSIIDALPPDAHIGLRVIGSNYNSKNASTSSASKLVIPVSSNGIQLIKNTLKDINAINSQTPITYSLKNAIERDFKSHNTIKHIILIAQNTDTCNNNPCTYINNLIKYRNDVIVDVIALGSDVTSVNQLQCLAQSTNGQYISVKSNENLSLNVNTTIVYMDEYNKNDVGNDDEIRNKFPPPPNTKIKYTNYLFEFNR